MGRFLRNGINERDQGLSSCSYKAYQPLKYPKCQKWGKVDSFTSRDIVTFLTGWFPLPSWNPGRRYLELQPFKTKARFSLLNSGSLKHSLVGYLSVSANLWLLFWWKPVRWPSLSLLPLHWFIGRKKMQLQWQLFPFKLHRYSAHNFQWLNRMQLTDCWPANFRYWIMERRWHNF